MPTKKVQLRALTDLSLRQSNDPESPDYQKWHQWPTGTEFTAPWNLRVDKALERGIVEEVKSDG